MKVRMKMTKTGPIRYVGHLDFMRFFQKALRRSGILTAFSRGYSTHMIIPFASPLGVGLESVADYVDVDLAYRDPFTLSESDIQHLKNMGLENEELPEVTASTVLAEMVNREMPEGVRVLMMNRVGGTDKAMALVRGADYLVYLENGFLAETDLAAAIESFLREESILIHKVTPKSESDVDIRPLIYELREAEDTSFAPEGYGQALFMSLSAGSAANLKPETVTEALCRHINKECEPFALRIVRTEMYADEKKPFSEIGDRF